MNWGHTPVAGAPLHRHHGGRRPAARRLPQRHHHVPLQGGATAPTPSYRPITLLNTDYRAFTQLLARRLCTALTPVIDRQQSALLPGRHIGDVILGMQLLPRALAAERSSAVAVFCRKALDPVVSSSSSRRQDCRRPSDQQDSRSDSSRGAA